MVRGKSQGVESSLHPLSLAISKSVRPFVPKLSRSVQWGTEAFEVLMVLRVQVL